MRTLNLAASLHRRYRETPERHALFVAGAHHSYGELGETAGRAAAALLAHRPAGRPRLERVGVLASRSLAAYVGVMAAVWLGAAYVPLNLKFPDQRLAAVIRNAELDALVVDDAGLKRLTPALLALCPPLVLAPCSDLPPGPPPGLLDRAALCAVDGVAPLLPANPDDPAYLLYTSGTTGEPKGVVVTNANLRHYLDVAPGACGFAEGERTSQHAELSFDLCTHDLFTAWEIGATLHVVPEDQLMAPAEFINAHQLTVWVSVPAVIAFMRAMRLLKPGIFPSLRVSGFGGEALPRDLADAWLAAAPNSRLLNGYGPTEATIGCTLHEYGPPWSLTPERGIVPVGVCHAGTMGGVIDEAGVFLPPRCAGQIVFHGPQVSAGYWKQPELTAKAFPMLDHPELGRTRWYLTGDHGYQDEDGVFHFLGRMDSQVKVLGHRIELDDVEHHLREVCGADAAAVVPWPLVDGAAQGLVGFVSRLPGGVKALRDALKRRLPQHMVPGRLLLAESMPLNVNGKIDRRALAARLDQAAAPG